ncbi:uncharacterized protein LOC131424150 isoform X3 [Marmota monax]|uniref:uncharacterized protein LOC131424150 isoform X3 n=1 Tax=Marmota monax TaxID=9995 RepID=UPI0026EA874B|nr:uncharacterized protein LOC131424150 isoform X3 [Marmota monax]
MGDSQQPQRPGQPAEKRVPERLNRGPGAPPLQGLLGASLAGPGLHPPQDPEGIRMGGAERVLVGGHSSASVSTWCGGTEAVRGQGPGLGGVRRPEGLSVGRRVSEALGWGVAGAVSAAPPGAPLLLGLDPLLLLGPPLPLRPTPALLSGLRRECARGWVSVTRHFRAPPLRSQGLALVPSPGLSGSASRSPAHLAVAEARPLGLRALFCVDPMAECWRRGRTLTPDLGMIPPTLASPPTWLLGALLDPHGSLHPINLPTPGEWRLKTGSPGPHRQVKLGLLELLNLDGARAGDRRNEEAVL